LGNPKQKSLIKVRIHRSTRFVAPRTKSPASPDPGSTSGPWVPFPCNSLIIFISDVIENIIAAKPNYVEIFLNGLKRIIEAEKNKDFTEQPPPKKTPEPSLEATIQAGIPLSQLNLHLLDTDTKLILAEKEQALLASHETIKILQMKTHRLEQLLSLKEKRIEELKRKLLDE